MGRVGIFREGRVGAGLLQARDVVAARADRDPVVGDPVRNRRIGAPVVFMSSRKAVLHGVYIPIWAAKCTPAGAYSFWKRRLLE